MARTLIAAFGSLRAVLGASPPALQRAARGNAAVVRRVGAVHHAMIWSLRHELDARRTLHSGRDTVDYLRLSIGFGPVEQVRLLLLDSRLQLLRDELLARGSADACSISVQDAVRRAIEAGAAAMIVAHNHPTGIAEPSAADRDITRHLSVAAHAVGIRLVDHLIVTAAAHYSFRASGQI